MTEPVRVPMDPITAAAAAMFEDDMAPLRWAQATDQQKDRWTRIAAEMFVDRELAARRS